jgi:hypothetical protein
MVAIVTLAKDTNNQTIPTIITQQSNNPSTNNPTIK